jgi:acyl-CoA reductase-like NAD-dependent aldehyde dehydrogenase
MTRLGLNKHLTHYRNLLLAANWAALGILYNTGQDCTAGSRLYVQDTIYDKFVTTLAAKAKELVIGDGFDEKSGGGPVVCTLPPFFSWSSG